MYLNKILCCYKRYFIKVYNFATVDPFSMNGKDPSKTLNLGINYN